MTLTFALPGKPSEALTSEIDCFSRSVLASGPSPPPPHSPVLIKISADNSPLNQLPVKFFFFHSSSKHFAINTKVLFMKRQLIWVFESLVMLHIICFRMQRVNLHARPSIIQVGCPTCCCQVCALNHVKVGDADLDYPSEPCHRNGFSRSNFEKAITHEWDARSYGSHRPWKVLEFDFCLEKCLNFQSALKINNFPWKVLENYCYGLEK